MFVFGDLENGEQETAVTASPCKLSNHHQLESNAILKAAGTPLLLRILKVPATVSSRSPAILTQIGVFSLETNRNLKRPPQLHSQFIIKNPRPSLFKPRSLIKRR
jgi:hypothetical protein